MHPEISHVMKYFYDDLEDHPSTQRNQVEFGTTSSRMFFINHKNLEASFTDDTSKKNEFEAKYAVELASYLVKQNIAPSSITILVMYLGQRQLIAKMTKNLNLLRGIRIAVRSNIHPHKHTCACCAYSWIFYCTN
jgi:superfamily I DNA and/or RNA helicase